MKAVNCLSIVVTVLPLVTTPLIYLDIDFAFSPQGILYSHEIFPLLLAPFAPAPKATEIVSRVIQSALLLAGFGPLIVAYLTVEPISSYALPQIMAGLCWLEGRPWTYGLSLVLASVVRLVHHSYRQPTLPSLSNKTRSTSPWTVMLSLCAVLPYTLLPSSRLPFPDGASLDIVVLSYPRPVDVELSAYMLNTTILSYLPYVSPSVTLSVFTHAPQHQAFELVRQDHPSLVFYVDLDTHPNDDNGHYLHLAEAFRWMGNKQAEWIMLVEDDFPLCPGGWEVLSTVIHLLDKAKSRDEINAGFIGTGGSGMIIHRSYLRLISMLSRIHSSSDNLLPSMVHRRAPDQIVQDCILGRPGSLCEREHGRCIISSRLVLDHIGGMATTTEGKAPNSDKWRCGWRHAFHGDGQVDVVVV